MTTNKNMALSSFAEKFNTTSEEMEGVLKTTVFRQSSGKEITNAQMVMLMIVADQYDLNPFTKEIYAFPDKQGGIVPVVGVDGWSRLVNSNKHFDGMEFRQSESWIKEDENAKNCPEWIEVVISRDDRAKPVIVREYLDECYRPAFVKNGYVSNGPWQTHTKRMLRHKAMIQGARIAFGFAGIYDEDEADRIMESNREAINVEGVVVEMVKKDAPKQTKSEQMADKLKRKSVKTVKGKDATEPDTTTDSKDDDAKPNQKPLKAALKTKITKCKTLEELRALHSQCMEFVGTEWAEEISKAYSSKKVDFENI